MQSILENCCYTGITRLLVLSLFMFSSISSSSQQLKVSGVVLDSSNVAPILDVHVYTKTTGTYTNSEGRFTLLLNPNDTLFFSGIGYRSHFRQITTDQSDITIILREGSTTLDTLTVYGSIDLRMPLPETPKVEGLYKYEWEKVRAYAEDRYIPRHNGPGFSTTVPWHNIGREKREMRKIIRYRAKNQATAVYRKLIESDDLKTELCTMFKITEADFYLKLEDFAKNFPSAQFLQSEDEIKGLLIQSFATKSK